jgi:hypothetical protein
MFEYMKDEALQFTSTPIKRKDTFGIVIHHFASEASIKAIHAYDKTLGWIGIGYNVCVMLNGDVVLGRGLDTVGAHAGRKDTASKDYTTAIHNNDQTIGIGFQGYYHPGNALSRKDMPIAQYNAGFHLIQDLRKLYPTITFIKGHGEMPATSTVCPGSYFPLAAMVRDGWSTPDVIAPDGCFYAVQTGAFKSKNNALAEAKKIGGYIILKDITHKTYTDL